MFCRSISTLSYRQFISWNPDCQLASTSVLLFAINSLLRYKQQFPCLPQRPQFHSIRKLLAYGWDRPCQTACQSQQVFPIVWISLRDTVLSQSQICFQKGAKAKVSMVATEIINRTQATQFSMALCGYLHQWKMLPTRMGVVLHSLNTGVRDRVQGNGESGPWFLAKAGKLLVTS